jgi:hypothetical protein
MRLSMLAVLLGGALFAQTPTPVVAEQKTQDQAPSVKELADLPTFPRSQQPRATSDELTRAYVAAIARSRMATAAAQVCAIPLVNVPHTDPHDAILIPKR